MCFVIAPHKSANGVYHYLINAKQTVMLICKLIKAFHLLSGNLSFRIPAMFIQHLFTARLNFSCKTEEENVQKISNLCIPHCYFLFLYSASTIHPLKSQVVLGACFKRLILKEPRATSPRWDYPKCLQHGRPYSVARTVMTIRRASQA